MLRYSFLLLFYLLVFKLQAYTYTVTNTNDNGGGSLRDAITIANAHPGADVISFSIAPSASIQRINLASQLPALTEEVIINGWSQGGSSYTGSPLIELNGGGTITYGLSISGNSCTIYGLSLGGFTNGIYISSNSNHIYGNYIGMYGDGTVNANTIGISLSLASNNIIGTNLDGTQDDAELNIISGNTTGIKLSQSASNFIYGNYIGTDATGTTALANTANGLELSNASASNTIGSGTSAGRNIISSNSGIGIRIDASNSNWIKGNYIGLDKTGTVDLGNKSPGIYICCGASNTLIGSNGDNTSDLGERNVVACNNRNTVVNGSDANIRIEGPNSNNTTIAGNFIGISSEGKAFSPNGGVRGIQAFNGITGLVIGGSTPYTRNVISSHLHVGVEFVQMSNSRISGNYLGTDTLGTSAIPNVNGGIQFYISVTNCIIGTDGDGVNDEQEGNISSGNSYGINMYLSDQNKIAGNLIGTDVTGNTALPNATGINCYQSNNNTFGGTLPAERNIISGNTHDGLILNGNSSGCKILNNYIGISKSGSVAMGNGYSGVAVFCSGNSIGDGTVAGRNIISGNLRDGVYISGNGSTPTTNIKVQGNYIGTDATGMANLGNTRSGIKLISAAKFITVGTDSDGSNDDTEGNLVSGNDWQSGVTASNANINIQSTGSDSNIVAGNLIGTDATGMALISGNPGVRGIQILGGTANMVGGRSVYARNIVGGQSHVAVEIDYVSGDTVMNNYIGTNKTGTAALKNNVGICVYGNAANHVIGTDGNGIDDALEGNLASGNNVGIQTMGGNNNLIAGNKVGTDVNGTSALPNASNGIELQYSQGNVVGGALAVQRNIVAGNGQHGFYLNSSYNNKIYNNYIGVDIHGTNAMGNGQHGVYVGSSTYSYIGSGNSVHRNIIASNGKSGIYMTNSTYTIVQGNYIGTDNTGAVAMGNAESGIEISGGGNSNVVGSDEDGVNDSGEGNVIAANLRGILVATKKNILAGNFIGTDASGLVSLANTSTGIELQNARKNKIGGTTAAGRNIIAGNTTHGILISGTSDSNQVMNNYIGLEKSGNALPNGSDGIRFTDSATDNIIGGTISGYENYIQNNGGNGINVIGGVRNSFRRNSIYKNGLLGIDLNNDGVTADDLSDADSGSNNLQNFPFIKTTTLNASTVDISGIMYGEPSSVYELEFFSAPTLDPSGFGEGQTYLGTTTVTTDASGIVTYNVMFSLSLAPGTVITATATSADNNTSEFSGPYGDPLPVKLISFEVSSRNGIPNLQWEVASEEHTKNYVIYASANGFEFDSIGYVAAVGSNNYSFKDVGFEGNKYYKLKMVDRDGTITYSPIRVLKNYNPGFIALYPNPCTDYFTIHLSGYKTNNASVKMISSTGSVVFESDFNNLDQFTIATDTLSGGLYHLVITLEEEVKTLVVSIVK